MIKDRWLPFLLLLTLVSASIFLRRSLLAQDRSELRKLTQSQLETISLRVAGRIQAEVDPLIQIAKKWNEWEPEDRQELWRFDAAVAFEPSIYEAIALLDPEDRVVGAVPSEKFKNIYPISSTHETHQRAAFESARNQKIPQMCAPVGSPDREQTFQIFVPVFEDGHFVGEVAGIFAADRFFSTILQDVSPGFGVAILDGQEALFRRFGEPPVSLHQWAQSRPMRPYGRTWYVQVWPTTETLAKSRSSLPDLTLAIGILVSFLLAGAVDFAQASQRRARESQETSGMLKREMAQREKFEEANQRFAAIVESSADAIIGTDLNNTIQTWNNGAVEMYGYRAEEVIGQDISLLIPDDLPGETRNFLAKIRQGKSFGPYETTRKRQDGKLIEVSLRISPVRNSDGSITGMSAVARDITEMKQLEQKFWKAQRMEAIGRMTAGIAHDFNNLLGIILGYADLASEKANSPELARTMTEEIRKAGDRAGLLVHQLLAYSRQEQLEPRVLDLNDLIANLTNMLKRTVGGDIELVTQLEPSLDRVKADPTRIEQVLMNLVVNARDAMPSGGKLVIQTGNVDFDGNYIQSHPPATPGRYVMLSVTDTGHGMDLQTREHLFEPFFTTKEPGKGTGLGLSTVYGIVKQNGGYIWVYSEVDKGTVFKIYLLRTDESQGPREHESCDEIVYGSGTILLVEDEEPLRKVTLEYLQASGYTVIEAPSAEGALAIAQAHQTRIDLLVTDVIMPGMGGLQLSDYIRRLHPETKVLYVSGYTPEMVSNPTGSGVERTFLVKPFSRGALSQKVRQVLKT